MLLHSVLPDPLGLRTLAGIVFLLDGLLLAGRRLLCTVVLRKETQSSHSLSGPGQVGGAPTT